MATYNVSAELNLRGYFDNYGVSDIEISLSDTDGVDVHDQSVESGEFEARLDLRFDIEAESMEDAQEKADGVFDNLSIHNSDNIEWEYDNHSINEITPPAMDKERAKEILQAFFDSQSFTWPEDVREALSFLLDLI